MEQREKVSQEKRCNRNGFILTEDRHVAYTIRVHRVAIFPRYYN